MPEKKSPILCLIDASGYLHRAYHALPMLITSKGEPVNALFGFTRMITKILKNESPDYLGVCFDHPKPTFRHEQYADYKGTRKETDEALIHQLPMAFDLAQAWGLPCLRAEGFEADDLIATLAVQGKKRGWQVLILTGDKDILQLVEEGIVVRDEIKKVDYNREKVFEKYGLYPNQLVDYFSLMGDKVDNVIGVPGVGEKTASKLLAANGTLEHLFDHLADEKESLKDKLIQYKDHVMKNRDLIRLRADVPLETNEDTLKVGSPHEPALAALLARLEFRSELFGVGPVTSSAKVDEAMPNRDRQVKLIYTENELASLSQAINKAGQFAYDFETDSLNPRQCRIVGMSIAIKENEGWYIPIGHHYIGVPAQLGIEALKKYLGPIFKDPSIRKIGQNLKYDNAVLRKQGIEVLPPLFDTMIAAYCINPNRSSFGLKDLAADFLKEKMTRIDELIGNGKDKTMSDVPIDQASSYAAADAEVTLRLSQLFEKKLKEEGMTGLFESLEMPLVSIIQSMEEVGVKVDFSILHALKKKFEERKKLLEKEIQDLAGEPFLVSSPKQLGAILFDKLKLPVGKKTKTGFSTSEDVLQKLVKKHPIAEKVISYRELSKLISTYVEAILEIADPVTHRVHTSFHQTGTITGRLSSSDPNMQNIPIRTELGREIRKAFVASEGCTLLSADYSQIDLRALAHLSEDPVLIETFNKGGDVHLTTASEVFHVPVEQVTTDMRRRAKAINFGIVYGQQAWGLSQTLDIDPKEADEFIKKYFERYKGIHEWIEKILNETRKSLSVSTLSGRRRRIEEINSENAQVRGFAERTAMNTPIQGTSADIIKAAMIRVDQVLKREKFKTAMLLQVHDELLFDVPEGELQAVAPLVKREMEAAYVLRVPLLVDLKVGHNWNDMEKWKVK